LEERKVVSVLFCDLVGFTAASEQADPEDVRARLQPYHARLREEIERHGGTVEKFVGDAVMAVFGAPVAHEDDAERAVRAGLLILEAIKELNAGDPGLGLQVRVGINSGEAVVALGARPELGEGIVTGDVVNTASRLQGVAPVGTVVVSKQTFDATERVFDYSVLEPVVVKGKAEPLGLYRPLRARARYGADVIRTHRTPLIGRELEKALLIGVFERSAQQRSCQLVTVVGEPGVGKSRLCAELLTYIEKRPGLVRWRQGRCLPYGEGITFWALGEIVKAEADILESDSAEVAAAKLEAAVDSGERQREWLLQRLRPLVGVEASSGAERQELFTAWRRFLETLAAARATVLVVEDVHWADETLLDFLEYLVEWSEGVPVLVLCAARPELFERRRGWSAGQRNSHTINLAPLSEDETATLVSHLVSAAIGPELERAVVARAGGNPLYAEEFVRLLADRGLDADETLLPDSVQALIAARLDTLTPERKSLLQDAAVVGKVFWAGAVAEIGRHSQDQVELALHELARKELVRAARTSSMEGEQEYGFWHLLVRDVCYQQIPRAGRAARHRAAAAWIERKAGERVEDMAEVLCHHYLQALELAETSGDSEQATQLKEPTRRYLTLAGERALGLDTDQAEARLARALELTAHDDPDWPALLVRWADAASQAGHHREADEALDQALSSLRPRGATESIARALQLRARLALRMGGGTSVELAAEAVELLEQEPPGSALVDAYGQLANSQAIAGAYPDTIATADRAIAIAHELGLPEPARALGYRGFARAYLGDVDGLNEMEHAHTLFIERGAGREAAVVQNNLALARYPLQGPARSLSECEDGLAFCKERGIIEAAVVLEANCPSILVELGRPDEAITRADGLSAQLAGSGDSDDLCEVRATTLGVRVCRGEQPQLEETDWLITTARTINSADISGWALSTVAAALAPEAPDRARAVLAEMEQLASRETPYHARQLPAAIRTSLALGELQLAQRLINTLEPRYPLQDHALLAARAQLTEAAGDHAEAAALYTDAARGWHEFGNVPERAYALLGHGRCLIALSNAGAEVPLSEARDVFQSMDYKPALTETEVLLERALAAAS
jgi:class 3 adenylate cyclase/tetratricopeptide (TPR) repeat protein